MNLTYEELQTLTTAYKSAKEELGKKLVSLPASTKVYNPATQTESSLFDILRAMNDDVMPEEVKPAHEAALQALLTFQNLMNEKIYEAKANNYTVSMAIRNLHSEYLKATDIPERLLSAVLLVNKKNIAEADHSILVDIYKSLGLTHYSTHTARDIVYYNPAQLDLDGLKNMVVMNSPSLFQHNYPNFWDNMTGEYVDADPLTACMLMVFNARKA